MRVLSHASAHESAGTASGPRRPLIPAVTLRRRCCVCVPCTCCGPPVIFSKTPKFCCFDLTDCFGQQAWQVYSRNIRTLHVGRLHDGNETRESRHTSDAIIPVATMALQSDEDKGTRPPSQRTSLTHFLTHPLLTPYSPLTRSSLAPYSLRASASRHSTPETEACTRPCNSVPEQEQKHHPSYDANVDPLPSVYQPPDPEPPRPHETHPLPPPTLIPNPNPNPNPNPSQVWAAPANCYDLKVCICCCAPCYQSIAQPIIPGEPARPRARPSPSPSPHLTPFPTYTQL